MTEPVVIATWQFGKAACDEAWGTLVAGGSALDAVEAGACVTEDDPAVSSVGFGGLPNCQGVVELDAAIMDGPSHAAGAVGAIVGIGRAASVARAVMERSPHAMLAGPNATRFALHAGFRCADLMSDESRRAVQARLARPSSPEVAHFADQRSPRSHDTIGICALDQNGNLAGACTTSGLAWKLPGRVGDSPLIGSGVYVDNEVGAAAATGNGDEILKVCMSYRVVMLMESGFDPQRACEEAVRYLLRKRPAHQAHGAACIAVSRSGETGAAATVDGFAPPDRRWLYAVATVAGCCVREGSYVAI